VKTEKTVELRGKMAVTQRDIQKWTVQLKAITDD
jgi:hypothetical protein